MEHSKRNGTFSVTTVLETIDSFSYKEMTGLLTATRLGFVKFLS
jgi:hypothetical protein